MFIDWVKYFFKTTRAERISDRKKYDNLNTVYKIKAQQCILAYNDLLSFNGEMSCRCTKMSLKTTIDNNPGGNNTATGLVKSIFVECPKFFYYTECDNEDCSFYEKNKNFVRLNNELVEVRLKRDAFWQITVDKRLEKIY